MSRRSILVSLVLFSCVSRRYHYRQRDEIVNVQGMIEDTHERWLDQEEEYMQERRLFYLSLAMHEHRSTNLKVQCFYFLTHASSTD